MNRNRWPGQPAAVTNRTNRCNRKKNSRSSPPPRSRSLEGKINNHSALIEHNLIFYFCPSKLPPQTLLLLVQVLPLLASSGLSTAGPNLTSNPIRSNPKSWSISTAAPGQLPWQVGLFFLCVNSLPLIDTFRNGLAPKLWARSLVGRGEEKTNFCEWKKVSRGLALFLPMASPIFFVRVLIDQ